jgi:hypothetical protein
LFGWKLYKYDPAFKKERMFKVPQRIIDAHPGAGNGRLVFEVNMPLWRFGRGKSRSMSVQEAKQLGSARITTARQQAASTRRRRNT